VDIFFEFFGKIFMYGGGSVAITYLCFQNIGNKWIENKFAERLDQVRHTQSLELQRLRVEIDSLLSGVIRLQEKEFVILPEAWTKLDEACAQVSLLVASYQRYPDLDSLNNIQLEEFLANIKLTQSEKGELRDATQKNEKYQELIFWYRFNDVENAVADFHNYVERNSIFMPPELKISFEKAATHLWAAMSSKEIGHKVKDWKFQNEGWDKVKTIVEPLREEIQKTIYKRLQSHGKSKSDIAS
jgi:hypothetical protein